MGESETSLWFCWYNGLNACCVVCLCLHDVCLWYRSGKVGPVWSLLTSFFVYSIYNFPQCLSSVIEEYQSSLEITAFCFFFFFLYGTWPYSWRIICLNCQDGPLLLVFRFKTRLDWFWPSHSINNLPHYSPTKPVHLIDSLVLVKCTYLACKRCKWWPLLRARTTVFK